jgi:hypothetical protein
MLAMTTLQQRSQSYWTQWEGGVGAHQGWPQKGLFWIGEYFQLKAGPSGPIPSLLLVNGPGPLGKSPELIAAAIVTLEFPVRPGR